MLHSVTELKTRPELAHDKDPKQERPSPPSGSREIPVSTEII